MRRTWTRAAWAAELIPHATIFKPDGPGPFPLVIQMHGCVGARPFERVYAEAARDAGVATLMIDSFGPRGLSRFDGSAFVCTGAMLRGAQRAADLFAAHDWAEGQSWVIPGRIAAAGWSHGAWSIMDALAAGPDAGRFSRLVDLPERPLAGLAGAVLVYPYAGFPSLTAARGWGEHRPPVAALLCGKDQVVGVRLPARAIDRLAQDGVPVDRLVFPDATHAFDDEGAAHPQARFRPDLREQTKRWYVEALTRALA